MTRGTWTIRLSDTAEADYDDILRWTECRFGTAQAVACGDLMATELERLERGPTIARARRRDEIGACVCCTPGVVRGTSFCSVLAASVTGSSTGCESCTMRWTSHGRFFPTTE